MKKFIEKLVHGDVGAILSQFPEEDRDFVLRLRSGARYKRRVFDSQRRLQDYQRLPRLIAAPLELTEAFRRAGNDLRNSLAATHLLLDQIHMKDGVQDLQQGQSPIFAIGECSDSRQKGNSLLQLAVGQSFSLANIGGSIEDRTNPEKIGPGAAEFLTVAAGLLNIKKFAFFTHGDCACIKVASNRGVLKGSSTAPGSPVGEILRGMAKKKEHLLGYDQGHLLGMLPHSAIATDPEQRRLQSLEISHAEHIRGLAREFLVATFPDTFPEMRVYSVYFNMRNSDTYLRTPDEKYRSVITPPKDADLQIDSCAGCRPTRIGARNRFPCDRDIS